MTNKHRFSRARVFAFAAFECLKLSVTGYMVLQMMFEVSDKRTHSARELLVFRNMCSGMVPFFLLGFADVTALFTRIKFRGASMPFSVDCVFRMMPFNDELVSFFSAKALSPIPPIPMARRCSSVCDVSVC